MSPADDAALLLAIMRRHLRTLRIGLEAAYPEEDWGFTAQQAAEKLLKAWLVLARRCRCSRWRPATGGTLPPASGEGRAAGAP
jgi:hypothetical protein